MTLSKEPLKPLASSFAITVSLNSGIFSAVFMRESELAMKTPKLEKVKDTKSSATKNKEESNRFVDVHRLVI